MKRLILGLVLVASVACSDETAASTITVAEPTTTTSTIPATTTTRPVTTTALPTTTSTAVTTTSTEATTTTLPEFPPEAVDVAHGGESWAVYLAVADDFTAPEIEEARERADMLGLSFGTGELGCDQGGAEVLGLDPAERWAAVSVLFDTEEDARQFVAAYGARGHEVVGFGLVLTLCLD